MGSNKYNDSSSDLYRYYGYIPFAVCQGPVQEILMVVVDGKIAWPRASEWAAGESINYGTLRRHNGRFWVCVAAHTSSTGNAPPSADYWQEYSFKRSAQGQDVPNWYRNFWAAGSIVLASDGQYYRRNNVLAVGDDAVGAFYIEPSAALGYRWWDLVSAEDAVGKYCVIEIQGYGQLKLWWGDENEADEGLNQNLTGTDLHPAYHGICWGILWNWFFGEARPAAPNVELVVRRVPSQSVFVNDESINLSDGQTNVITAAAEVLTSEVGAGLTVQDCDASSFHQISARLTDSAPYAKISALIDSQVTVRQAMETLAEHSDAWVRYRHEDGKIEAGAWTHGDAPTDYHTLTVNDLAEKPQFEGEGWDSFKTAASITFSDRKHGFKNTSLTVTDVRAHRIAGQARVLSLSRPWITRPNQARVHAGEALRVLGRPQLTARVSVRRERARSIYPGDWLILDIDPEPGGAELWQYFRVVGRRVPYLGPIELELDADETIAAIHHTPDDDVIPNNEHAVPVIENALLLPCPHHRSQRQNDYLLLVERPSPDIVQCVVHFTVNGDYTELGTLNHFAVRGLLHADMAGDTGDCTVTIPEQVDLSILKEDMDEDRSSNDKLILILARVSAGRDCTFTDAGDLVNLAAHGFEDGDVVRLGYKVGGSLPTGLTEHTDYFVVSAATDSFQVSLTLGGSAVTFTGAGSDGLVRKLGDYNGPVADQTTGKYIGWPIMEACSVKSVSAQEDGTYTVTVNRGRLGTRAQTHESEYAGGDITVCWFAWKSGLVPMWHSVLRDRYYVSLTPSAYYFKLQSGTWNRLSTLADCADWVEPNVFRACPGWPQIFDFVDDGAGTDNVRQLFKSPAWPQNVTLNGQWKDFGRDLTGYSWVLIDPEGDETDIGTPQSFAPLFKHPSGGSWTLGPISIDPTGYSSTWRVFTILCIATDALGRRTEWPYYIQCGPD